MGKIINWFLGVNPEKELQEENLKLAEKLDDAHKLATECKRRLENELRVTQMRRDDNHKACEIMNMIQELLELKSSNKAVDIYLSEQIDLFIRINGSTELLQARGDFPKNPQIMHDGIHYANHFYNSRNYGPSPNMIW